MKKLGFLVLCSILLLTLPGAALASPDDIAFTIRGKTTDPGEQTYIFDPVSGYPVAVTFTGLKAKGSVKGGLKGKFSYVEDGTVDLTTGQEGYLIGDSNGLMTITKVKECPGKGKGTIDIHFWGSSTTYLDASGNPVTATIVEQPFEILGGTGACEGISGGGTRSATLNLRRNKFLVTYTGHLSWD